MKATSKKGEDYDLLQNMYTQLLGQRNRELGHVANIVGGSVKNNVYFGDGDKVYETVPGEQQKKAVSFLLANAFKTPTSLITPDIIQRLEANGAADRILGGQVMMLSNLLNDQRFKRMAEQATREPSTSYSPASLMEDLTGGLFGELKESSVTIDLYRRNLQRSYANRLITAVQQETPTSDMPALARGSLVKILGDIAGVNGNAKDETTKLHLADLKARIGQALEPHPVHPAGRSAVAGPIDE